MHKQIREWSAAILNQHSPIRRRLGVVGKILRSFLPWREYAKMTGGGALDVMMHRQWTNYSCTAAVAQMVAHYYGIQIGHRKAIALTKCKPDGASLSAVARALKKSHGLRPRTLRVRSQIRSALQKGQPVMTNDSLTYENNHAILLVGETPKGFWIADPAIGEVYWRHERSFFAAAEEFIAVAGPN